MEEENLNTTQVPETPVTENPVPESSVSTNSVPETTENTSQDDSTVTDINNAVDSTTSEQAATQVVETEESTTQNSDVATTAPNTRIAAPASINIESNGSITVDNKAATNEQLESYFDYTKYTDKKDAQMVEGILKSDTVTINGVTYNAELNKNGEMVSTDGTKRLTQEEIKGYFGEKGYEALVCKTTKDVTIDKDGKISIKDRAEQVILNIPQSTTSSNLSTETNTPEKTEQEKIKDPSSIAAPSTGGYSGGGGGYSGGGGGHSGGGSSGGSYSGGDKPNEEEVEDPGTPVIMVEFGQLEAIRDELQTLKGQLNGVSDDYGSTINSFSGDSSAWGGIDKDAYVSQKKGYATNMGQVSSTLSAFVSYLDTCVNNYKELEAKLSSKQISL